MIDTSKLSRALRVGRAGIRAEVQRRGGELVNIFLLPDGTEAYGYLGLAGADVRRDIEASAAYQTWLRRAKCEHNDCWVHKSAGATCVLCSALESDVRADHYTLLPEPGDVCAVVGCGGPVATHANPLCSGCWRKWIHAPFVKPIGNNWTHEDDRRAWAAKQSEGGGATNERVPRDEGSTPPTIAGPGDEPGSLRKHENGCACKICEAARQVGSPISVYTSGDGDEPGSVFDYFAAKDGTFSNVLTDPPAPSKECLDRAIGELKDYMSDPRPPCQRCNAPLTRRTSAGAYCYYCVHQSRLVAQCKESLDRPLTERIEQARQELGFHDGYGVYSLPGEAK